MELKNTKEVALNGVKMLVYGKAGAGKTTLISTLPNPIILATEKGLLSLSEFELPYIEIKTLQDLYDAYEYSVKSEFESIALDSISDIAEVILSEEKKKVKDPRQAYGAMQELVSDFIRAFRDIEGKHVFFTAKLEKTKDEMERILYAPSMPGNKIGQALPYFFDEVFALRVEKDADGNNQRAMLTDSDGLWEAKDRSGKLERWEMPHLGNVIKKIIGEK